MYEIKNKGKKSLWSDVWELPHTLRRALKTRHTFTPRSGVIYEAFKWLKMQRLMRPFSKKQQPKLSINIIQPKYCKCKQGFHHKTNWYQNNLNYKKKVIKTNQCSIKNWMETPQKHAKSIQALKNKRCTFWSHATATAKTLCHLPGSKTHFCCNSASSNKHWGF